MWVKVITALYFLMVIMVIMVIILDTLMNNFIRVSCNMFYIHAS